MSARHVVLCCTPTGQCDFHRDGGPEVERCPGACDTAGCNLDGHYEVGEDRTLCAAHGAIVLLARAVNQAIAVDNATEDA